MSQQEKTSNFHLIPSLGLALIVGSPVLPAVAAVDEQASFSAQLDTIHDAIRSGTLQAIDTNSGPVNKSRWRMARCSNWSSSNGGRACLNNFAQ